MRNVIIIAALAAVSLAACASTRPMSSRDKLALYQSHAAPPVKEIRYTTPMGWEEVGDEHLLLNMRPTEAYLLRISGPCLKWGGANPTIQISAQVSRLSAGFDRIKTPESPVSCRIEEIRPVDIAAVRDSQRAMASQ